MNKTSRISLLIYYLMMYFIGSYLSTLTTVRADICKNILSLFIDNANTTEENAYAILSNRTFTLSELERIAKSIYKLIFYDYSIIDILRSNVSNNIFFNKTVNEMVSYEDFYVDDNEKELLNHYLVKYIVNNIKIFNQSDKIEDNVLDKFDVIINNKKNINYDIVLSEEQEEYIKFAESRKESILLAGPGSGKTTLIIEYIRRINKNSRILVLMFNRYIEDEISTRLQYANVNINKNFNSVNSLSPGIHVMTFHKYALYGRIKPAGISMKGIDFDSSIAIAASVRNTNKWDYVFIDESQDMDHNMFQLVKTINTDKFIFAGDLRQALTIKGETTILYQYLIKDNNKENIFKLSTNYRSIPEIVTFLNCVSKTFYTEIEHIEQKPYRNLVSDISEYNKTCIKKYDLDHFPNGSTFYISLAGLIHDDKNINYINMATDNNNKFVNYKATVEKEIFRPNANYATHIINVKGLERENVIIGINKVNKHHNNIAIKNMIFTGISRARDKIVSMNNYLDSIIKEYNIYIDNWDSHYDNFQDVYKGIVLENIENIIKTFSIPGNIIFGKYNSINNLRYSKYSSIKTSNLVNSNIPLHVFGDLYMSIFNNTEYKNIIDGNLDIYNIKYSFNDIKDNRLFKISDKTILSKIFLNENLYTGNPITDINSMFYNVIYNNLSSYNYINEIKSIINNIAPLNQWIFGYNYINNSNSYNTRFVDSIYSLQNTVLIVNVDLYHAKSNTYLFIADNPNIMDNINYKCSIVKTTDSKAKVLLLDIFKNEILEYFVTNDEIKYNKNIIYYQARLDKIHTPVSDTQDSTGIICFLTTVEESTAVYKIILVIYDVYKRKIIEFFDIYQRYQNEVINNYVNILLSYKNKFYEQCCKYIMKLKRDINEKENYIDVDLEEIKDVKEIFDTVYKDFDQYIDTSQYNENFSQDESTKITMRTLSHKLNNNVTDNDKQCINYFYNEYKTNVEYTMDMIPDIYKETVKVLFENNVESIGMNILNQSTVSQIIDILNKMNVNSIILEKDKVSPVLVEYLSKFIPITDYTELKYNRFKNINKVKHINKEELKISKYIALIERDTLLCDFFINTGDVIGNPFDIKNRTLYMICNSISYMSSFKI